MFQQAKTDITYNEEQALKDKEAMINLSANHSKFIEKTYLETLALLNNRILCEECEENIATGECSQCGYCICDNCDKSTTRDEEKKYCFDCKLEKITN